MEPGADPCRRCARWRTTRSFAWHALLFIGGLYTLSTLASGLPLHVVALQLLVFWCLGLTVCGAVFLVSICCPCQRKRAVGR